MANRQRLSKVATIKKGIIMELNKRKEEVKIELKDLLPVWKPFIKVLHDDMDELYSYATDKDIRKAYHKVLKDRKK